MPSQAQYLELSALVREAQCWWNERRANNGGALGAAIDKAITWLRPRLSAEVVERLIGGPDHAEKHARVREVVDEVLADVACAAVKDFAKLEGMTGKEFYHWLAKMADCRLRDLERRRRARRKRGVGEVASLDRDDGVRKLAAMLEDDLPSPEAVALLKELKHELRGATKGLSVGQKLVVNLVKEGLPMTQIVAQLGPTAQADWRIAKAHIRRKLETPPPQRPRKPK